jgi:hypothetical protein
MSITRIGLKGDGLVRIDDTGLHDFIPATVAGEFDVETQDVDLARLLGAVEIGACVSSDALFGRAMPPIAPFMAQAEKAAIRYDCLPEDHIIRKMHPPEYVAKYLADLRNKFFGAGKCPYS